MYASFNIFRLFIFGLLYFLVVPVCLAQDEAVIRKMLESGDQKKLNKDNKIRDEADNLMNEVITIYEEMRSIRLDSALKTRSRNSKAGLLEKQSWQKQVQASALYEKGNNGTYGIYKKYLNRFWKEHEGEEPYFLNAKMHEEQARDNYAQASLLRRNARHMNLGVPKVEKLTEANHLEAAAIRKQVISLGACYGISEQPVTPDSIPAAPAIADTASLTPDTAEVAAELITLSDEVKPEPVAAPVAQEKPVQILIAPVLPVENENQSPAPQVEVTGMNDQTIFRIQIVASRTLLMFEDLAKISPGNFPVEVVSEEGWLKYQFMGVPLYADAQRIFRDANVKGAFIVSYRKGIKQNLPDMISISRELERRIQAEGRSGLVVETFYHLEITASKTALKAAEIAKIYNGPEPVLLIMEKGLYKYHLNAGYSPDEAMLLKQKTGLTDANIVAYKNARPTEI